MESLSKSSNRRKHSTATANAFSSSFSFKNPYADVLLHNGAERKSLQVHEYSEIFSGSSSIPVLDLSAMDERLASGDLRSSKLDYTNIFSTLTHDDVFVPYEELLSASAKRPKPRIPAEGRTHRQESGSRHSSRKTERPPGVASGQSVDRVKQQESGSPPATIKTERPSGGASNPPFDERKLQESGPLHPSTKTERPSDVASDQSTDGIEQQFNLSFNRTNQINIDASEAKTHIAELHVVPGFTHFVDGSRPHKGKNDRPPLLKREVSRTWSFSAEVAPVNGKGGPSLEKSRVLDKSHHVNEGNLESPLSNASTPSSYPINQSDNKETMKSKTSGFASKEDVSQKIVGESSEDSDDSSADAVSAAALKKAIAQAQESIRMAKIIMERKKDCSQDGSKLRPISCLKVANRETKTDCEALGSKNSSTRRKYEELDPTVLAPAGIDGKLTPPLSDFVTCFPAERSEGKRALQNVEIVREPAETFAGGSKLFASNHFQSETTHFDENVKVEKLEKNVEADEVHREGKSFSGCEAVDSEPAEAGNFNSLVPPISGLASNLGRLETGNETSRLRNVTATCLNRSEVVPELVEGALHTSQRTQEIEKCSEEAELCNATFVHAGPEITGGKILSSSERIAEHDEGYEACEDLRICPEDGANEQRANDRNDEKRQENKLEECDKMANARSESNDMVNESHNLVRNESLDQQEMDGKTESVSGWEGDDQKLAKTCDEKIRGTSQKEHHQLSFDDNQQLKEVLLEVINDGRPEVSPEVRESKIKVDEAHRPHINDNKQDFTGNGDEPKSSEDLVQNQVEEEHVNSTFQYETVGTNVMEASDCTNFQKRQTGKIDNTKRGAGRDEGQEAAYDDDIYEAVNLSGGEASIIFDVPQTDGTSNFFAETEEPCHVESISKPEEDQKSVENSEEDVTKSTEEVSTFDEDKMEARSFGLLDDEILRTNYLHRSASEEIFVKNNLLDAFEGLPTDSRPEAVDVMGADPEENWSKDEDVSKPTSDIHSAAQEYAAEINEQDIPQDFGSHFRGVELNFPDVEQMLGQAAESDDGSISSSSFEKIDESSAQKSEECAENVKITTSKKEELSDDMVSDERKCAGEPSEELCSQLHDEPKEKDKPLESEEAVDTDVEKDKEDLVGRPSMEEKDAKEGMQDFESNDQQQRIEAIKRGREREKDRIAVERAIREARERAFAEVRERAERAAVERAATEVRQRVMAEAREKAEKPPVVKQPLDKASTEAKLQAERAAVERATAEARERALEKAKSLKTPEELKTPADRHSTERFSSSSRNNILKHSYSSSDLETGTDSESAQRRKARLERHQRIMERAAKALAEKNMRDHLAQKEQAERNRLAESLDADIKRWATGKEGNLRALLSTLQYILGLESGWQSISLTEIITTAAVKKAYRKATLCVHPDKLQQRGASVQQKYICEKVFDLLKAAWNRFNSDER